MRWPLRSTGILLVRKNYVKIVPVPQFDIMQEFRHWVPEAAIGTLWDFWHAHTDAVDAWIPRSTL